MVERFQLAPPSVLRQTPPGFWVSPELQVVATIRLGLFGDHFTSDIRCSGKESTCDQEQKRL